MVLALALALTGPVCAADAGGAPPKARGASVHPGQGGPYPPSWRAKKIRAADRCWRACLADTGREFQACLRVHRPTLCVNANAPADRYCLRQCRLSGGPWVTLAE